MQQKRFASSPDIERGLLGNLVALRAGALSRDEADLIWWIHRRSHCDGGLFSLAREVLERCGSPAAPTPGSAELEKDHLARLTEERGEISASTFDDVAALFDSSAASSQAERKRRLADLDRQMQASSRRRELAEVTEHLPEKIAEFCLNPQIPVCDGWPNSMPELCSILNGIYFEEQKRIAAAFVHTAQSRLIWQQLDAASEPGAGTFLLYNSGATGKSFAARAYCEAHPGRARYFQPPCTNDAVGFYRALCEALGMASGLSFKAVQMREKIKRVLLTRQLLLVVDGANWLMPVSDYRYALPERMNWILTALSEQGVPVAMIAHANLFETIGQVEARTGWNRSQFVNQLSQGNVIQIPDVLSADDLLNVAKAMLPKADRAAQRKLADFMTIAPGYLHAGHPAARRAEEIASRAGRDRAILADMDAALETDMKPALRALSLGLKRADDAKASSRSKVRNWRPDTEAQLAAKSVKRRNRIVTSSDLVSHRVESPVAPLPAASRSAARSLQHSGSAVEAIEDLPRGGSRRAAEQRSVAPDPAALAEV
jgi:AAA domain